MFACCQFNNVGSLYISSDFGSNWLPASLQFNPGETCDAIAVSSDADYVYMFYKSTSAGSIAPSFMSNDYGQTWNAIDAHQYTNGTITDVATSGNGQIVVGCGSVLGIYYNNNYGQGNWTAAHSDYSEPACVSIAMSSSGQRIAAASPDALYQSDDYGTTWVLSYKPRSDYICVSEPRRTSRSTAVSADGSFLLASLCAELVIGTSAARTSDGSGSDDGLSAGGTAGVVIGGLVGAVLAAAAVWRCFLQPRASQPKLSESSIAITSVA